MLDEVSEAFEGNDDPSINEQPSVMPGSTDIDLAEFAC